MEGLKPGSGDPTGSFADRAEAAGRPRLEQLSEYCISAMAAWGSVTREETQSTRGTDRRVARPDTPTRPPGLPLARCRPGRLLYVQLVCC